ncbi:MAG: MATE family efflux transporter [Patescibacteria group bacterium]|jgi:putative MATE family efflux protein
MESNRDLLTKPIPGLIRHIAVPGSVGFIFNTLYNIIDTFFGGRISTDALAAMSLSFPVFFIIIAMGSGISTGATALMANALGAGDAKKARVYSAQAISFSIILSLILTWVGITFSPFLFRLLGAEGEYLNFALAYINVIFYGTVFFLLSFTLNSVLVAQGNTKTYRNLLIVGFFLNIILDPWFIYGGYGVPAMGIAGVAWATVLVQVVSAGYLFIKIIRTHLIHDGFYEAFRPKLSHYYELAKQGFPASLNMMTVAIGVFVITYYVSRYGREAVAAYGIATRFDQMALLPIMGINMASLALVGQNNGARLFNRVREIIKLSLKYGISLALMSGLAVLLFARPLVNLFSSDPAVIAIGEGYLKISVFVYVAYTILFVTVSILQGLKKPFYAVIVGAYRQIAAPLIIFWLLASFLGFGLLGIWWGIFIINWSAALFTLFYLKRRMAKLDYVTRGGKGRT